MACCVLPPRRSIAFLCVDEPGTGARQLVWRQLAGSFWEHERESLAGIDASPLPRLFLRVAEI